MKHEKVLTISVFAVFLVFFGAGCNPFAKEETQPTVEQQPIVNNQVVDDTEYGDPQMAEDTALSNPATVYCLSRGGEFSMKKTLAGTTEGYCIMEDGQECEVWALYKGECADIEEPEKEPEEEEEEDAATSTDDILDQADNTSTNMNLDDDEYIATSTNIINSDNQNESGNSSNSATDDNQTTDGKKKITGAIDIAVKPGEEAGEIVMSWDTHDLSATEGYYVMLSGDDNVTYPAKYQHELNREESYAFTWVDLNPEKEYFFRVCIKSGDSCGTYSPIISMYPKSDKTE